MNSEIVNWRVDDSGVFFYRVKNGKEVRYRIGECLGSGNEAIVYNLMPSDKTKKIKVIKMDRYTYDHNNKEYIFWRRSP